MSDDPVEPTEFELMLPFVVTRSHGGPYDDSSYVAGFELGQICGMLPYVDEMERPVHTTNLPCLDLAAMREGFEITSREEIDDTWTQVKFERIGEGVVIE